jgi:hypothetical protein
MGQKDRRRNIGGPK